MWTVNYKLFVLFFFIYIYMYIKMAALDYNDFSYTIMINQKKIFSYCFTYIVIF